MAASVPLALSQGCTIRADVRVTAARSSCQFGQFLLPSCTLHSRGLVSGSRSCLVEPARWLLLLSVSAHCSVFSVLTSPCSSSPAPLLGVYSTTLCWEPEPWGAYLLLLTLLVLRLSMLAAHLAFPPRRPGHQTFPDMMCRMDTIPRRITLLQVHPDLDKEVNKQIVPSTCIPLAWHSVRYFAGVSVIQFMNLIISKF